MNAPATVSALAHTQPEQTPAPCAAAVELPRAPACARRLAERRARAKHGDAAAGIGPLEELDGEPDLCLVLGRRRHDPQGAARARELDRARVRDQLRNDRLPRGGRSRRARGGPAPGVRRATSRSCPCPRLEVGAPDAPRLAPERRLVPSPAPRARRRAGVPARRSGGRPRPLRRPGRRHARPARRATTSRTRARSSPGAWRATSSASSRPTRSPRARSWSRPTTCSYVRNAAGREAVDLVVDGEHVTDLASGDEIEIRFRDNVGRLAQGPGANFYRRVGEKFGALAR